MPFASSRTPQQLNLSTPSAAIGQRISCIRLGCVQNSPRESSSQRRSSELCGLLWRRILLYQEHLSLLLPATIRVQPLPQSQLAMARHSLVQELGHSSVLSSTHR